MRMINCKKCGTRFDLDSGECPECGAVYYVLPESELQNLEDTRVWSTEEPADAVAPPPAVRQSAVDNGKRDSQQGTADTGRRDSPAPSRVGNPSERPSAAGGRVGSPAGPVRTGAPTTGTAAQGRDGNRRETRPRPAPRQNAGGRPDREQEHGTSGREAQKRQSTDMRVFLVGALVLLAILTVVACAMTGVFSFGKKSTDQFMPSVIGKGYESVKLELENLGVKVERANETASAPVGTVIRQSAAEGKKITKNEVVILFVSTGETGKNDGDVTVPNLVGMTFDQAKFLAESLDIELIRLGEEPSSVRKDEIIRQTPKSSEKIKLGEAIRVVVSMGPEPSPSPSPSPSKEPVCVISVTAGAGGAVSPKGLVEVREGASQTFTITPNPGYEIVEVKIDGVDAGAVTEYTFADVTKDHSIYVVFRLAPSPSPSIEASPSPSLTPTATPSPLPSPVVSPDDIVG